jgi:hypothetical protein
MKQLKQPQAQATQDALEMEVFEDAPVADLDTPVAGEIENGAEVPQNEGPDETGNELQPGDEITDPDPVEIPEEEMQVGDIQDDLKMSYARRSRS